MSDDICWRYVSDKCHRKRPHIVETESFGDTFGPKAQRKKPRLDIGSIEELGASAASADPYTALDTPGAESSTSAALAAISQANPIPAGDIIVPDLPTHAQIVEPIYSKGTSRRIFGELYKVLDSSDVIVHVLDARDPIGTKCDSVIDYLKKEKPHKQIIFVINKCDLIPTWATVRFPARFFSSPFPISYCTMSHVKFLLPLVLRELLRRWDCYGRGKLTLPSFTLPSFSL